MQEPLQITFKGLEHSDAIEARVQEYATKLEKFYQPIIRCGVVVEAPDRHSHHGQLYRVRIDLTVPGDQIVVSHQGPNDHAHEDVYVAPPGRLQGSSPAASRLNPKETGQVKRHDAPQHARVTKLYLAEDYGFLEGHDEVEVYFHRNAVLHDAFEDLGIGTLVRYVLAEGEGESGPQASTVEIVGEVD